MLIVFNMMSTQIVNNSSYLNKYLQYLDNYDKHYNSTEFWTRYDIYVNNTNYISKHNNENYTMGINRYTDMSRVEFRDIYFKKTMKPHSKVVTRRLTKNTSITDAIDWRANGWVTNVKDQQQCGS